MPPCLLAMVMDARLGLAQRAPKRRMGMLDSNRDLATRKIEVDRRYLPGGHDAKNLLVQCCVFHAHKYPHVIPGASVRQTTVVDPLPVGASRRSPVSRQALPTAGSGGKGISPFLLVRLEGVPRMGIHQPPKTRKSHTPVTTQTGVVLGTRASLGSPIPGSAGVNSAPLLSRADLEIGPPLERV